MTDTSLSTMLVTIVLCGMILGGVITAAVLRGSAMNKAQAKTTVPNAELVRGAHASSHQCCTCKHYISKFTPPTTWTAHTMEPTLCQCSTNPETKAFLAGMDPLVAEAFHNFTCSPLCRLPEEVLINITLRLDPLSVQCLRRACRLFLRLYSSPEFSSSQSLPNSSGPPRFLSPWPNPCPKSWSPGTLPPLLDMDIREYCMDCRTVRASRKWWTKIDRLMEQYMHCSGCRIDHIVGLFSAAQRDASPKTRICIGREGFVRICNHYVVKWDEVVSVGTEIRRLNFSTGKVIASVALQGCNDPSHYATDHVADSPQNLHQFKRPAVHITGRSDTDIGMEINWNGHLYIPDHGRDELGYNKQATPTAMRQHLDNFRKGVAEFIAPEYPPGRLVEMGCFDPNFCCCLRYSGSEKLPTWQLLPLQKLKPLTCRADPEHRLEPLRSVKDSRTESSQAYEERTGSHHTYAPVVTSQLYGQADLQVQVNTCPGGSPCLRMAYIRYITIGVKDCSVGVVTPNWYQALDPDSYGLQDDDESFGVSWCRQKGCRNYYQYAKKPLVPTNRIHRRCRPSCYS